MDKWLDSLSEDWPSQPPSQRNSSSILQDEVLNKGNSWQSRLPRRSGSGFSSISSIKEKEPGRGPATLQNHIGDAPLKEKSNSSLNAAQRHRLDERAKFPNSDAVHKKSKTRDHSASSTPPVSAGTVAYKASPKKDASGTPEWKRRVVQGKIGQCDQTDMFGPIGLESVFKPPSASAKPVKRNSQADISLKNRSEPQNLLDPASRAAGSPKSGLVKFSSQPSVTSGVAEERVEHESAFTDSKERAESSFKDLVENVPPKMVGDVSHSPIRYSTASISKPRRTSWNNSRNDSDVNQSSSNSFSPFVVSKSHTMDGKVDYAAVDHGMKNLNVDNDDLEMTGPGNRSSEPRNHDALLNDKGSLAMSFRKSQMNDITNQSLPEDLSVGTDAYAANGGFVSVRRGGYSNEGSFKERSLSPSPLKYVDGRGNQSMNISNLPLPSQISENSLVSHASPPVTPKKDDEDRPRSSGSPLKLFDHYDTFTNNRLARHISRFEETLAQNETPEAVLEDQTQPCSPSLGPKLSINLKRMDQLENYSSDKRLKSFGSGELDDLDFSTGENENAEQSLLYLTHDVSDERPIRSHKRGRRKVSRGSRSLKDTDQRIPWQVLDIEDARLLSDEDNALRVSQDSPEILHTKNGKRLPDSPKKKVSRKRRKTLCSSEERKRGALDPQQAQPPSLESTAIVASNGRKRKDARHGSDKQPADPKTLAMRQILRPRNPTPNQTSSSARQKPTMKLDHKFSASTKDDSVASIYPPTTSTDVDPPTQIVAGALATIALNTVQEMETGSRKVSVTTSDFFNEAQQIMALIRAEKRPRSSHNSAETSNLGPPTIHEEVSAADSTKDDLTRPPSREGGSLRTLQLPNHRDARVVSHLRKFEDKDDLGLALPSSGKSLRISHCDIGSVASPMRLNEEDNSNEIESDPPNIRILAALSDNKRRDHIFSKSADRGHQTDRAVEKTDSQSSTGSLGRRSVPTGSSQGSANIKKIAPQSVAHLLSDQMADMFFDKSRQVWVKRKAPTGKEQCNGEGHTGSDGTEEDLFGGIPDLTVDEMEELKLVKDVVSSGSTLGSGRNVASERHQAVELAIANNGSPPRDSHQDERPRTADGKMIHPTENSSAPSKHTNFAWSGPTPGTRATSYGDEVWSDKNTQGRQATMPDALDALPSPEVEHEISIFHGRENPKALRIAKEHHQPRVVTVAFSSPLIQSPYQPDEDWVEIDQSQIEDSPSRHVSELQVSARKPNHSTTSRFHRRVSHRLSFGNSSIMARPMSRLDEQDELSLVHYSAKQPQANTDLAVATPIPPSRNMIMHPASGHRSSIGFELSPLPDFTVHQVDRPLDDEEKGHFDRFQVHKASRSLSLTAQEILRHLTDLEPFEPYWYYIQNVVLQDRGLSSLHLLDEFCGKIQHLDVSKNDIRELGGVPSTVRSLDIRDNCLSDLTSWHTLLNLQYVDFSGNQVRSLRGFQDLVHLRSLIADNNQVESLDGIEQLDGLLNLRLRNNKLSSVSFERCSL